LLALGSWPPGETWAALESVAAVTRLVGLIPAQSFEVVRDFAPAGHIGARANDDLIARAAQTAGAQVLVTWDVGHFRGLTDGLDVRAPTAILTS
jgi:predicted nucleic acid-binding protein